MSKVENIEVKNETHRRRRVEEGEPQSISSGLSTKQLFAIVLIVSIGFNCYIGWRKHTEHSNESEAHRSDSTNEQQQVNLQKIEKLQKKLTAANELIELMKLDQIELDRMFSLSSMIEHALKLSSKPVIHFASNDTRATTIAMIAAEVIARTWPSCNKNIPIDSFDMYKNCFRDLAIELHNRLESRSPNHLRFFVTAGRTHYTFTVTTMNTEREEYFISFGDVMFEVLQFDDVDDRSKMSVNDGHDSDSDDHRRDDSIIDGKASTEPNTNTKND